MTIIDNASVLSSDNNPNADDLPCEIPTPPAAPESTMVIAATAGNHEVPPQEMGGPRADEGPQGSVAITVPGGPRHGTVTYLPIADLHPHPKNVDIYAAVDPQGPHYREIEEGFQRTGILTPLVIAWNTPDTKNGMILAGHTRWEVARRNGLSEVPVILGTYASRTEADEALIILNRQRQKDHWVTVMEIDQLYAIEVELAKGRMGGRHRPDRVTAENAKSETQGTPGGGGSTTGETRTLVGQKIGRGKDTVELARKLAAKAREQAPANPAASDVAKDLKANVDFTTVARRYGILQPLGQGSSDTLASAPKTGKGAGQGGSPAKSKGTPAVVAPAAGTPDTITVATNLAGAPLSSAPSMPPSLVAEPTPGPRSGVKTATESPSTKTLPPPSGEVSPLASTPPEPVALTPVEGHEPPPTAALVSTTTAAAARCTEVTTPAVVSAQGLGSSPITSPAPLVAPRPPTTPVVEVMAGDLYAADRELTLDAARALIDADTKARFLALCPRDGNAPRQPGMRAVWDVYMADDEGRPAA